MTKNFWIGKNVFLTGHSGFKGGWTALYLSELGANVHGYSLPPASQPSLWEIADVGSRMTTSTFADIRDFSSLCDAIQNAQPDIVIHMAAQSLVRQSYKDPIETYSVNIMGTVNVLEAVRKSESVVCVVNVTTDKCYENQEWIWPYRETDPMGGYDPYSSSKGCSELVTAAYVRSFFETSCKRVSTARAGNVIGGGDWANDRLLPDFFRANDANKKAIVRYPDAVRPWQHVLEPVSGYLTLAEALYENKRYYPGGWNFGPEADDAKSVSWIMNYLCKSINGAKWASTKEMQPHESRLLRLDVSKAKTYLKWRPKLRLEEALDLTVSWYEAYKNKEDMAYNTVEQINEFRTRG